MDDNNKMDIDEIIMESDVTTKSNHVPKKLRPPVAEVYDCPICVEKMGHKKRNRSISCNKCSQAVCMKCASTYVLDTPSPMCMYPSCGSLWDRRFMSDNFPASFVNGPLKCHATQVYFDMETALLPGTQVEVTREINMERYKEAQKKMRSLEQEQLVFYSYEFARRFYVYLEKIHQLYYTTLIKFQNSKFGIPCVLSSNIGPEPWESYTVPVSNVRMKDKSPIVYKRMNDVDLETLRLFPTQETVIQPIYMGLNNNLLRKKYYMTRIKEFLNKFYELSIDNDNYVRWHTDPEFDDQMTEIAKTWEPNSDFKLPYPPEVKLKYDELHNEVATFYNLSNIRILGQSESREHRFIRKCCDSNCKGYLSPLWKCGTCNMFSCIKCHLIIGLNKKDDLHICDAELVATAALIISESKPCPGCSVNTYKIDGCNQMWCTQCRTAWHWKTGKIETRVHNPHYFEYLRTVATVGANAAAIARNPLEVRCGREIDLDFVNSIMNEQKLKRVASLKLKNTKDIDEIVIPDVLKIMHTLSEMTENYITGVLDEPDTLPDRIKYMRKKTTEAQFKKSIQMKHKKNNLHKELRDIFVMVKQAVTDILYLYQSDLIASNDENWLDSKLVVNDIETLFIHADEWLKLIGKNFGSCKCFDIKPDWRPIFKTQKLYQRDDYTHYRRRRIIR